MAKPNKAERDFPSGQPELQLDLLSQPAAAESPAEPLPEIPNCYINRAEKILHHCSEYADLETPGHKNIVRYFFKLNRGVELNGNISDLQSEIYKHG